MSNDFTIVEWDDGHKPGSTSVGTKMAINNNKAAKSFVQIYDDFLSEEWCDKMYDYALNKGRPWGAYVTTEDIMNDAIITIEEFKENPERAFSLEAVRCYYSQKGAYFLREDSSRCAVWCLSSGATNEVKYHIDYAELYRYETNTIHPPLYAGTCQVSPLSGDEMIGGDFAANTSGLDHYKKYGYKGLLSPPAELEADMSGAGDWVKIRYKRNRGIIHDGDFPHYSSPVQSMPEGKKRVILGFNFFSAAVADCNIRAPEHSDAFNRTVKLYQMMSKISGEGSGGLGDKYRSARTSPERANETISSASGSNKKGGFSAKDIAKNPAMARMFVLAARKMKAVQIREAKEANDRVEGERLRACLEKGGCGDAACVEEIDRL